MNALMTYLKAQWDRVGAWALILIGFGALLAGWLGISGTTILAAQMPYIVSGGFTAIGLILVGLTLVNIATKRQDAAERSRQLSELRELLSEMRSMMEDDT